VLLLSAQTFAREVRAASNHQKFNFRFIYLFFPLSLDAAAAVAVCAEHFQSPNVVQPRGTERRGRICNENVAMRIKSISLPVFLPRFYRLAFVSVLPSFLLSGKNLAIVISPTSRLASGLKLSE
jgi:hypothetical protein